MVVVVVVVVAYFFTSQAPPLFGLRKTWKRYSGASSGCSPYLGWLGEKKEKEKRKGEGKEERREKKEERRKKKEERRKKKRRKKQTLLKTTNKNFESLVAFTNPFFDPATPDNKINCPSRERRARRERKRERKGISF